MKFKFTEETTSRIFSNSIVLVIAITFYFLLKHLGEFFSFFANIASILSPFIIGFIIAYLLSGPVVSFEKFLNRFLFKKAKKQSGINRGISIALVFIITFFLLSLVIYSIIPQLVDSVTKLARNTDLYVKSINEFLTGFANRFNLDPDIFKGILGSSQEFFKKLTEYFSAALPKLLDFSVSVGSGISNFIIGFIISIYMLSSKELFLAQTKKVINAILPQKTVSKISALARNMHETFGNYITGKILDCIIVGIICFIFMNILGMEYALLISIVVMVTNFIPFIGPFIGAIPSAFILLMVQPTKVIWFIVMIFVLQQIDGNLLGPKIVGKTTGISSFWVIFSILLGGGFFGIAGVALAVPTFSVIYVLIKSALEKNLRKKNLPTETKSYYR